MKHRPSFSPYLFAALAGIAPSAFAATFNVTEATDNGLANIPGTLSHAIRMANDPNGQPGRINGSVGADIIELQTNVLIEAPHQALIDSDITINGNGFSLDGGNSQRPLFIKSGNVQLNNLNINNGLAQGMVSNVGGSGAGLGGAVFIYDGNVSFKNVTFNNNQASGRQGLTGSYSYLSDTQGGGAQASSDDIIQQAYHGASSLFGIGAYGRTVEQTASGNYGGFQGEAAIRSDEGYTQGRAAGFGGAGVDGSSGGFGGGGGSHHTKGNNHGGFGGGGGWSGRGEGGLGGFGASSSRVITPLNHPPVAGGFATANNSNNNRDSAGLGGAIFIRKGQLHLQNVSFNGNRAIGGSTLNATTIAADDASIARGFGGAVFAVHTTENSNGNNQAMPETLPTLQLCNVQFNQNDNPNFASHAFEPAISVPGQRISLFNNNSADIFALASQVSDQQVLSLGESELNINRSDRQPVTIEPQLSGCFSDLNWQIISAPNQGDITFSDDGLSLTYSPQAFGATTDNAIVEVQDSISGARAQLSLNFTLPFIDGIPQVPGTSTSDLSPQPEESSEEDEADVSVSVASSNLLTLLLSLLIPGLIRQRRRN